MLMIFQDIQRLAAPVLYTSVRANDFNNFFYGTVPPSLYQSDPTSRVLSKNRLLEYTVSLHICSKDPSVALQSTPTSTSTYLRPADAATQRTFRLADRASMSLTRFLEYLVNPMPLLYPSAHYFPPNMDPPPSTRVPDRLVLPKLNRVHMEDYRTGRSSGAATRWSPMILRLARPTYVCGQYGMVNTPPPPYVITHAHASEMELEYGVHNVVYLSPRRPEKDEESDLDSSMIGADALDIRLNHLKLALSDMVVDPDLAEADQAAKEAARAATSITIYGLVPPEAVEWNVEANDLRVLFGEAVVPEDDNWEAIQLREAKMRARKEAQEATDQVQERYRWWVTMRQKGDLEARGATVDADLVVLSTLR